MEQAKRSRRWLWAGTALVPALAVGLLIGGGLGPIAAQDATPTGEEQEAAASHPAHIHTGTCEEGELGDVVQALNNLTQPTGQAAGQRNRATLAATSFTNVPLTLDAILAEDHAVNVHLSDEEIGTYIACGEVGGVVNENGALVIGLRQQNDSGYTGIAYLAPGADGASTDVSAFVAQTERVRGERRPAEGTPEAAAAQEAAATEEGADAGADTEAVDVSLVEWAIDMPTTLPAGPTTFNITNDGTLPHNFEIEGQGIEEELEANLEPGESGTLEVTLEPGTYEIYCPVGEGSHRQQGMELELTVE